MAFVTNTLESYDVNSNREDLSDMVFRVERDEAPVVSMAGRGKASSTNHEWTVDALATPGSNAHDEGDDESSADALSPPTKLSNYTQILKKKIIVSGTQQNGMTTAGINNYVAYEKAKKMVEIKRDLEWAVLNGGGTGNIGNAKNAGAGDGATARELGSLHTYLDSNASVGATGAASAGNGAVMTTGTDRTYTEALLTTLLSTMWGNGSRASKIVMSPGNRGLFSDFAGGSTRYIDTNTKELVHSIDVYVGDFHTLEAVPSDIVETQNVFIIDPKYLKIADLRGLSSYDLGKTGDNIKHEMVWETTLEVCNPNAHGIIADLDTGS